MLRQQMRAIQNELGERIRRGRISKSCKRSSQGVDGRHPKELSGEMSRLEKISAHRAKHQCLRTYLEYVVELPWKVSTEIRSYRERARILDEEHSG